MSMKLHAFKASTTSRTILLFLAENKIDFEFVMVDLMTGEHTQAPYTDLNPSKQVPTLVDGDFVLTESSTILKYLADKIDSPTYPKGLKERAKVNEMMDWFNTSFYREYGYHLIYPQIYPHHARSPEEGNQVTINWGKDQSPHWLGVLDRHWLGKGNPYLCGNQITIADYFGSGLLTLGDTIGVTFSKYPNIQAWVDRMHGLASWPSVNDAHDGFTAFLKEKTFTTL